MRNWNSLDKIIVDLLRAIEKVDVWKLHYDQNFTLGAIASTINRLTKSGLGSYEDGNIVRTEDFEQTLFRLRHQIYNRPQLWKHAKLGRNISIDPGND